MRLTTPTRLGAYEFCLIPADTPNIA